MFPYFTWHCSIPYYQANTGYERAEIFIWSCRTVNPLIIQLHLHKVCNEQVTKTRERCMYRPGERDF